jgi:hypothetical protein
MNKIDLIFPRTTWRPQLVVCENAIVAQQHAREMAAHGIPVHLSWKARGLVPRELRSHFDYFLSRDTGAFLGSDLSDGIGTSSTVTFVALQYAYYLGADPVVLVGCDHSFKYDGKPSHYVTMKGSDPNHFDPNYFAHGSLWGTPNLEMSEIGYRAARKAFEAASRTVLDATVGGLLNVFQKVSIDQALTAVAQKQRHLGR